MTGNHPAWCSPRQCTAVDHLPADGGEHRSEPIGLDLRRVISSHGPLSASGTGTAFLSQAACAWTADTFLRLEAADTDMYLPLSQAAAILAQITDLIHEGSR